MGEPYRIDTKKRYAEIVGREPGDREMDGRTLKKFLEDVTLHQTVDGKPMWTDEGRRGYRTNGLPTEWADVSVENKYGSGETTGFVGANYRTRNGEVKLFQAHFMLGEVVSMPVTAVASLKRAKTFRKFDEVIDGERRKTVRQVQKYIVEKA